MSLLLAAALAWTTVHAERGFIIHGKPIDPACPVAAVQLKDGQAVALKSCQTALKPAFGGGYFSVDHSASGGDADDSYSVLAASGARYAISINWNSGGSGIFSSLLLLRRDGDTLVREKAFSNGGDRCNGGIAEAEADGATLTWSENLTPYDLVARGGVRTLEAYKDLEASASSCVATVDHTYHLDTGREDAVMVSFDATHLDDVAGWTEQYKYQHCFNAWYGAYASKHGGDALTEADVKAFAAGFLKTCVARR